MSVTLEALLRCDYRVRLDFDLRGISAIGKIRKPSLGNSRKLCTGPMYGSTTSIDKNAAVFIITSSTSLGRNRSLQVQNLENERFSRSFAALRLSSPFGFRLSRYFGDRENS